MPRESKRRLISIATLTLLAVVCGLASLLPAKAQSDSKRQKDQAKASSYQRVTDASQYVGAETCKTCHEDMPSKGFFKSYEDSPHFVTRLDTKRGPEWHGCEACHGPGKEHVEGGGDKSKIFTFKNASAADISARCLGCHEYGAEHANFGRSAHLQNNVSCTDCHDPHHAKENDHLMKAQQPQLCYGCHLEVSQQFTRTFHHRVNEGLVKCTDCHNPERRRIIYFCHARSVKQPGPHGDQRVLRAVWHLGAAADQLASEL